jgi:hypothetical protein
MDPIAGARNEGGIGLLKGFGTGTMDLFVRSSAGHPIEMNLIVGVWVLPAYTMRGVQAAGRNYQYRHEMQGDFEKRFASGLKEYQESTHEQRQQVLRLWKERGYRAQVKARGEMKENDISRTCTLEGCQLAGPHKH